MYSLVTERQTFGLQSLLCWHPPLAVTQKLFSQEPLLRATAQLGSAFSPVDTFLTLLWLGVPELLKLSNIFHRISYSGCHSAASPVAVPLLPLQSGTSVFCAHSLLTLGVSFRYTAGAEQMVIVGHTLSLCTCSALPCYSIVAVPC